MENLKQIKEVAETLEAFQDDLTAGTIHRCIDQLQTVLDNQINVYDRMPQDVQNCWNGQKVKHLIDMVGHCISDLNEMLQLDKDDTEYVIILSVVIYELKALL